MYVRRLGSSEIAFVKPPGVFFNIVQSVQVKTLEPLTKYVVGRSVELMVQHIQHLRVNIEEVSPDEFYYKEVTDFSETFSETERSWEEVSRELVNTVQPLGTNRCLFRVIMTNQSGNESTENWLVFMIHHVLGDGVGMMNLVDTLLTTISNLMSGNPHGLVTRLISASNEDIIRDLMREQGVNIDDLQRSFDAANREMNKWSDWLLFPSYAGNHTKSAFTTFSTTPQQLDAILGKCKQHGVTMGSLVFAAMQLSLVQCYRENVPDTVEQTFFRTRTTLPIGLRKRLGKKIRDDDYGEFFSLHVLESKVSGSSDVWELAKCFVSDIKHREENLSVFCSIFVNPSAAVEAGSVFSNMKRLGDNNGVYGSRTKGELVVNQSYLKVGQWAPGFGNFWLMFLSTDRLNCSLNYGYSASMQQHMENIRNKIMTNLLSQLN